MSLTVEEQRARVLDFLRLRESMAGKIAMEEIRLSTPSDGFRDVDGDLRVQVEAEFHTALGRQKYVTSDGRVLWLTAAEIADRRSRRSRRTRQTGGPKAWADKRTLMFIGFNLMVIALALVVAYTLARH